MNSSQRPYLSSALRGLRAVLLFAALLHSATAKPLPVPFASEYQAENWGLEDGFPENSCSGIVAADDGYIWIGTFRGLARFNGHAFKAWAPEAMPTLRSVGIMSMYRDRGGRVWLSTMDGLVTNQGDTWRLWSAADGWSNPVDHVRSYAENAAGEMVLTRFSGRVLRLEGGKFRELPDPPGTGGTLAGMDADGTLYFFRNGHAGWFVGGAWEPIAGEPQIGRRAIGAAQSRDGSALIVCRDELLRLRGGRITGRVRLSEPVSHFWHATEESDGTLWLASVETGVYRIKADGSVRHFRKADGLPSGGGTRVVHVNDDGIVWIGSGVGGLTRFRPTRFRYLGEDEGLPDREVLTLTRLRDGRMLFAPYGSGLHVFDGVDTVRPHRLGVNLPVYCRAILQTRDGTVWLGSHGAGLMRVDGVTTGRATTQAIPLEANESVHSLFEDSRGRLWVGGERTTLRLHGADSVRVPLPSANAGRRPTIFAERRDGSVLIGQHHEIFVHAKDGLPPEPLVRLSPDSRISTLLVDERDRVWIGTAGHGLSAFHQGKLATLPPGRGLPASSVAALIQDDEGHLWFGCGRNVMRAEPDELWAAMNNLEREPRILRFDRNDGVRYLDFTYGTQPNVQKDAEGRLWFAMIRGVAMIDPRTVRVNNRPPPVVIEGVSYVPDGALQAVALPIANARLTPVLPAGSRSIRIDYAALDFSAPGKQRFRVALDGEWQDTHADASVSFLELPPGRHTLRVQAAGSDGAWNRTGATLNFEIAPFFWQTGWFRAAVALSLLGFAGSGVWLISDRRTRTARENLERERRLVEAQARLALVLENTSDFVAFSNGSGSLAYLNRAGRALIGLAADADVRGIPVASLFPRWAQRLHLNEALPAAQERGTWSGESALLQQGGEVPVSLVVIAHRDTDGAFQFASMIARDISTAKRHALVQDALRRLATALTASLRPLSLGRAVADACRALFAHDAFFLVLVADDNATQPAYAEATPSHGAQPELVSMAGVDLPADVPEVLEGRSLLLNGRPAPCNLGQRPSLSAMYAPVCSDRRIVGVVSVQSYADGRYQQRDIELLETVADHCAAAIVRLNAEELLRRKEEQLRQSQKTDAAAT